jgi:predicted small integral membrane protein
VFTSNPFAELSASIPPTVMQTYIVVMILMVVGGTLLDIMHKKSAKYFFNNWQNAKNKGTRRVGSGEMASVAIQTALVDVLASGEFCNVQRRVAHLLTMYGFLAYVAATVILVFAYPTPATPAPAILPALWYIGALMVCLGGYWFWFFIRADVAAEGNSPFRLVRADLFVVSLLASATLGLLWAYVQTTGNSTWANVFLALYLLATTVLFGSIPWSKFSHMFFKPAAAFQKRVEQANGSRSNLPAPADSPEIFGSARRQPQNY